MDANELSYALVAALSDDVTLLDGQDKGVEVYEALVFQDTSLITRDDGLLLTLEGGDTFQITVVKVT
jgi:hypothetical protein